MKEKSKILIIEDDESTRKTLEFVFRKKGYDTETAGTGKEALKMAKQRFFNVALLDIMLPDTEGTELLVSLKEMHPFMDVIVMTGHASMENTMRSLNGGASAYFTKPLKLNEMLAAVKKMLEKQWQEIEKQKLYQEMHLKLSESIQEELIYLATHDALTGLPNRTLFQDRLSMELVRARRNKQKLAVMLIDLDHFKDINDRLGHSAGDKLLRHVGQRLSNLLRKSDSVARIGGDEFLLLLPEISQVIDGVKIAQKVLAAMRRPFRFNSYSVKVTVSIGISIFPDCSGNAGSLIRDADIAMYKAKEAGRDKYSLFSDKDGGDGKANLHSYCERQYPLVQNHVLALFRSRLRDAPRQIDV